MDSQECYTSTLPLLQAKQNLQKIEKLIKVGTQNGVLNLVIYIYIERESGIYL